MRGCDKVIWKQVGRHAFFEPLWWRVMRPGGEYRRRTIWKAHVCVLQIIITASYDGTKSSLPKAFIAGEFFSVFISFIVGRETQTYKSPKRIQFSTKTLHKSILYQDGAQLERDCRGSTRRWQRLAAVNHAPTLRG